MREGFYECKSEAKPWLVGRMDLGVNRECGRIEGVCWYIGCARWRDLNWAAERSERMGRYATQLVAQLT